MNQSIFSFLIFLSLCNIYGHGSKHQDTKIKSQYSAISPVNRVIHDINEINKIQNNYTKLIHPIFKNKCFDCHSQNTKYPWYYKIPGIKQLIDHDVQEAVKHLDFSSGFPFKGHHLPSDSLIQIKKVLEKNTMPPGRYQIMHSQSKVTKEEKEIIINWVDQAIKVLGTSK